jgi:hypothetical protein
VLELKKKLAASSELAASVVDLWRTDEVRIIFELTTIVEAGRPFVSATYLLESDGPTQLVAHDIIVNLKSSKDQFDNADWPMVRRLASDNAEKGMVPPAAKTVRFLFYALSLSLS